MEVNCVKVSTLLLGNKCFAINSLTEGLLQETTCLTNPLLWMWNDTSCHVGLMKRNMPVVRYKQSLFIKKAWQQCSVLWQTSVETRFPLGHGEESCSAFRKVATELWYFSCKADAIQNIIHTTQHGTHMARRKNFNETMSLKITQNI